jgi:hypothetical protein
MTLHLCLSDIYNSIAHTRHYQLTANALSLWWEHGVVIAEARRFHRSGAYRRHCGDGSRFLHDTRKCRIGAFTVKTTHPMRNNNNNNSPPPPILLASGGEHNGFRPFPDHTRIGRFHLRTMNHGTIAASMTVAIELHYPAAKEGGEKRAAPMPCQHTTQSHWLTNFRP